MTLRGRSGREIRIGPGRISGRYHGLGRIMRQQLETEFEGLRLVLEEFPDHWQAFVYDPEQCEVLDTAALPSIEAAKLAALDSAILHAFGPSEDLNRDLLQAMLLWEAPAEAHVGPR